MPKCILSVDDDPVVLGLIQHTLQGHGYEVITAQDGKMALEILQNKIPDLILLDVQMPNMNGYTFISEKLHVPSLAKVPIVVISSLKETMPLFKRHGVKAYLLKPLNIQALLETVQAILPE